MVVSLETEKSDGYGGEVGKVLISGREANLEQVKRGMACRPVGTGQTEF